MREAGLADSELRSVAASIFKTLKKGNFMFLVKSQLEISANTL
jgi:hypothetical protein